MCVGITGVRVTVPMTSGAAVGSQTLRKRILTIFPGVIDVPVRDRITPKSNAVLVDSSRLR